MIKASVVLSLAWCAIPWLRRRSAAERHWLWALTLATAAVMPVLSLILPAWQPLWASKVAFALPTRLAGGPFAHAANDVDVVVRANAIEPTWSAAHVWYAIWVAGTAIVVLKLVVEALKLARFARAATPLRDGPTIDAVSDLTHLLRVNRPIKLLHGAAAALPVTWGLWHPRILMPALCSGWSEERRRVVLAHELAHIGRGDWLVQILAELCCAMYWFNPIFWMARNRLNRESEHACDDIVLNLGVDGSDYAAHLLAVARASQMAGRRWSPTVSMARPSHLEQRFAALLDCTANRQTVSLARAISTIAVALLVVPPLAAMSIPETGTTIEVRTADLPAVREPAAGLQPTLAAIAIRQVRLAGGSGETTATTTLPEILEYTTPPLYSDEARARRAEGVITVEATIDATGRAHAMRVVRGLGFGLNQNALVAVRQWQFLPAARQGVFVETTVQIDIEFSLRNEALNELIANDMATRVGPGVTPPRAVRTVPVAPPRPSIKVRRGTVVLDVVLLEDGTPKIVRILRSLDAELDESAVQAFERWRFSPAKKDGRPVKVRMNAEVTFHG